MRLSVLLLSIFQCGKNGVISLSVIPKADLERRMVLYGVYYCHNNPLHIIVIQKFVYTFMYMIKVVFLYKSYFICNKKQGMNDFLYGLGYLRIYIIHGFV